ncbi:MAG: phage minor head protein [Porcipelethomonas sp.]
MNKREKEVLRYTLEQEKAVIEELKAVYSKALDDIGEKIRALMADELTQSKIYQIEYQKALKGQVSAGLDNLNSEQYDSISGYLKGCYEDGFIGALYNLQGFGIPLIIPIDQEQVVDALLLDSKISEGLYTKLGNNVGELKKAISQEISRGISTAMPYADIARNLRSRGNMTINQSMNIVQTEGHRIQSRSALDAGEKAKAKGADLVKVWDSTLDSKTRPHHRALDGQVRELDEDFEVDGLTADSPGHFGTPSEDCRCRCAVLIKPRWDVDGSFTKRNNETGELLEFENVKSYEEFKKRYWETVDNSGGSGIIKESERFEIHPDKINKFLLKPGAKHSKEFFDVGYSDSDYEKLFDDISSEFDESKAVDIKKNADGTEDFSIFMNLGVKTKKRFRIVWRKDTPDSKPRLITGHRED